MVVRIRHDLCCKVLPIYYRDSDIQSPFIYKILYMCITYMFFQVCPDAISKITLILDLIEQSAMNILKTPVWLYPHDLLSLKTHFLDIFIPATNNSRMETKKHLFSSLSISGHDFVF